MARKGRDDIGHKAWNLLRLALLWARKGGVFKRRLMVEVPKFLKSLCHTTSSSTPRMLFHRQLSFDKTPIIHLKMHRPASMRFNIPCITTPQVDFDYDFDKEDQDEFSRRNFLMNGGDEGQQEDAGCEYYDDQERIPEEEKGIDLRADEFIAKFYEQMKLQRQISYLQYYETPKRSAS